MQNPENPVFIDPSISYEGWEGTNKIIDEERKRVDDAQVKAGVDIFFREIDRLESLEEKVSLPEWHSFDRELFGRLPSRFHKKRLSLSRETDQVVIQILDQSATSREAFIVNKSARLVGGEDTYVEVNFRPPLTVGNSSYQRHLIRMANWLLQYYKEQTRQTQEPEPDLPLDAPEVSE